MEKVLCVGIIQYLLKTRSIRLQQEQFAPEAFSVLVIIDILIHVNVLSYM